jgi:hypothetical protein
MLNNPEESISIKIKKHKNTTNSIQPMTSPKKKHTDTVPETSKDVITCDLSPEISGEVLIRTISHDSKQPTKTKKENNHV